MANKIKKEIARHIYKPVYRIIDDLSFIRQEALILMPANLFNYHQN